ncbi:MAG: hypothetical protein ACKVX9_14895 [Blastocatellia bacterium]
MRRLSSNLVPIFKASPFLLAICSAAMLWQGTDEYSVSRSAYFFGAGLLVAVVTRQWKRVYLNGGRLIVVGLRSSIEVPLHEIAAIEIVSTRRIAVIFRRSTPFGLRISFVGRWAGFDTPEIAHELNYLVHRARTMHPARPHGRGQRKPPRDISRVA